MNEFQGWIVETIPDRHDREYLLRYGPRMLDLQLGNVRPQTSAQEHFRNIFSQLPSETEQAIDYILRILDRSPQEPEEVRVWCKYLFQVIGRRAELTRQEYRQIPNEGPGSREDFLRLHNRRR